MTKSFIIESKFLGTVELPADRDWEQNTIWLCQQCGEVYGRETVFGRPRQPTLWGVMLGCCRKCIPAPWHWNQVPGSIWQLNDAQANKFLPEAALRRELLLTIAAKEKGLM